MAFQILLDLNRPFRSDMMEALLKKPLQDTLKGHKIAMIIPSYFCQTTMTFIFFSGVTPLAIQGAVNFQMEIAFSSSRSHIERNFTPKNPNSLIFLDLHENRKDKKQLLKA